MSHSSLGTAAEDIALNAHPACRMLLRLATITVDACKSLSVDPAQGFKVVIRDIALHMANRAMDYGKEDSGLCGGALDTRRRQRLFNTDTALPSVQEYLETSCFVQVHGWASIPRPESRKL